MKFVRVSMPDGSQYDVPLQVLIERLAKIHAEEFAENEFPGGRNKDSQWKDCYERCFASQVILYTGKAQSEALSDLLAEIGGVLAWNIDVADFAVRVKKPLKVDLVSGWINGPKEVIEK